MGLAALSQITFLVFSDNSTQFMLWRTRSVGGGVFSKLQIAQLQLITPCETASLPEEENDNLGHHDLEFALWISGMIQRLFQGFRWRRL